MSALRRIDAPTALFGAALLASGLILAGWLSDLTFWRDEWGFLLQRRGSDPAVFLEPHYEHIAISLIAVYKGLLAVAGMDSPRPFQLVAVLAFLLSVTLLFVYVRRRFGPWLALAGVLPILVLGPAWDDLLWPFQIGFFGSMSGGIGALLALERRDRLGDALATVLLVVAITFSSLGIPFLAGALVLVAWDSDRFRRLWVVAIPGAVYALWWIGWGHTADSFVSAHNLATSISYVSDGFASSIGSLVGVGSPRDEVLTTPLDWGRPLLLGALALAAWRLHRVGRISRELLAVIVIAVVFWFLAGLNASIFRQPSSGRYQYMGAIFIVLIAAELLRGTRPKPGVAAAVLAAACLAALSNLSGLSDAHGALIQFGQRQPAALAALELARERVDPGFELTEENSGVDYLGFVDADSYFDAIDDFGSPAMTLDELAAAPEVARASADTVLAAALELEVEPTAAVGDCAASSPQPGSVAQLPPQGGLLVGGSADVEVRLRRFASAVFPAEIGRLRSGEAAWLKIPTDRSGEPWEVQLPAGGGLRVCPRRAGG